MLRDITLGQYFPGNTPIHRLDPRCKLIWLVGYITALFFAVGVWGYVLITIVLALSAIIGKIKPGALFRGLKPLVFIIILTAVINILYGTGEPLFSFWVFNITVSGIVKAIFMAWRIMLLVCGTFILTYTTTPLALTDGLETLLNPLKKLKVPVHELSMMMSIALRFIPTLIDETDKIMSAQKARGASFDEGSLLRRAKAMVPLLVPLFVSTFRRADELATAMECRCYHGGEGRTRMKRLKFSSLDAAAFVFLAVVIAAAVVLHHFGL